MNESPFAGFQENPTVIARFFSEVNAAIEAKAEFLCTGKAMDYADYKRVVGKIDGLRQAQQIYREIISDIEEK